MSNINDNGNPPECQVASNGFDPDVDGTELGKYVNEPQLTDWGNALRFARLGNDLIRYCPNFKQWYVWNYKYWEPDIKGKVYNHANRVINNMFFEAGLDDKKTNTKLVKHALQSQNAARLRCMIELARTIEPMPILQDQLDTDDYKFNLQNGTYDLKQDKLLPYVRADYITKISPVTYSVGAIAPRWLQFLKEIMPDQETIDFLQRCAGYSLAGDVSERCFFLLYGKGTNGKSTFLNTISAVLADYATTTGMDTFMRKWQGEGIPNDIAALRGTRFVSSFETTKNMYLAEGRIKMLTGRDPISARFLRAEFFQFFPKFKIWLCSNHKPKIMGIDKAIWDRVRLVPFQITITDEQDDKHLGDKLMQELPGVFNWMLQGCRDFLRDGLGQCPAVKTAVAEYKVDMDIISEFVNLYYVKDVSSKLPASQVYKDYHDWAETQGEKPLTAGRLKTEMEERGIRHKRQRDGSFYLGLMNKTFGGLDV